MALAGPPARQVREPGPGFSNGHPARAKRSRPPVDSRCAACRPRLTAAQGPRVEQRAIVARSVRHHCAVAEEAIAHALDFSARVRDKATKNATVATASDWTNKPDLFSS